MPRTTLYVRHLPLDCDRDFEDFFSQMPGYLSCRVRTTKNYAVIGFVEFSNEPDAAEALDRAQGQKVNRSHDDTMIVEFARAPGDPAPPPRASRRSRSPPRNRDRSPPRNRDRSPPRNRDRSPPRIRDRSPPRNRDRSPVRTRDHSPYHSRERSPIHKRDLSPTPRSPIHSRERSPIRRSRSPIHRSRSPVRRSRSPARRSRSASRRSRSPLRIKDRSSDRIERYNKDHKEYLPPKTPNTMSTLAGPYGMVYAHYMANNPPYRQDLEPAVLYIEGVPLDATEREVSHIFRPFSGFRKLKLVPNRDSGKHSSSKTMAAYVDFDSAYQAMFAKTLLKGYLFDEKCDEGLYLSVCENDSKRARDDSDSESRKRRRSR